MAKTNKEYIPVRYDRGTEGRVVALADYIARETPGRVRAENVGKSAIMRYVLNLGLEIIERRAAVWRAELELT